MLIVYEGVIRTEYGGVITYVLVLRTEYAWLGPWFCCGRLLHTLGNERRLVSDGHSLLLLLLPQSTKTRKRHAPDRRRKDMPPPKRVSRVRTGGDRPEKWVAAPPDVALEMLGASHYEYVSLIRRNPY